MVLASGEDLCMPYSDFTLDTGHSILAGTDEICSKVWRKKESELHDINSRCDAFTHALCNGSS